LTTIVVQLTGTQTSFTPSAPGVTAAGVMLVVVDNSGATLPGVLLTGKETPPWSATLTGATGPNEATGTAQAVDSAQGNLGTVLSGSESGTGGVGGQFFQPTGMTITVT
jgi:hypothetical protein